MDKHKEMVVGLRQIRDWLNSQCDYPDEGTFNALDEAIAALEAKPLAEGWAGPQRFRRRVVGPMCEPVYDDYIPVWLNYQPKEGKRVAIYGVGE